ncbi:MAG: hypothetical protein ACXWZW_05645, partial [Solirubrobacterales bacterium]
MGEEIHVDLGGRIPHLWMEGGRSTLDLIGPGLTVLTGPWGEGPLPEPDPLYGSAPRGGARLADGDRPRADRLAGKLLDALLEERPLDRIRTQLEAGAVGRGGL